MPLPEEGLSLELLELPQPLSSTATRTRTSAATAERGSRRRKVAQILADERVGHALTASDAIQDGGGERRNGIGEASEI